MPACAPWGAVGEFAASRHGVLSRRQAATLGLTPNSIARMKRDGLLAEPVPGVLVVVGSPSTWLQQLSIATSVGGAPVVAGFRAAAALTALHGYRDGALEVLTTSRRRIPLAGLVIHHGPLDPEDVTVVAGIPTTTVARTLADLGSVDPPERVEAAFNDAWRRGLDLRRLRLVAERLHRPGQSGTRVLLDLLERASVVERPFESPLEGRVERLLRRARLPGVVRQHVVRDPQGRFVARVDFAIPQLRLAIEAHSMEHHFGLATMRDAARDERLLAVGWESEFVTAADTRREATVARLRDRVRARARELDCRWDPAAAAWLPKSRPSS